MSAGRPQRSAAHDASYVAPSIDEAAVHAVLERGPRGALVIASTCLTALLLGWLAFYFLLFLPRGAIN